MLVNRTLSFFLLLLIASACAPVAAPTPPAAPLTLPAATALPSPTLPNPTAAPSSAKTAAPPSTSPTADAASLLTQQVKNDTSVHPRPKCEAGTNNEQEWADYGSGLAAALGKLFSDPRGQSLSWQALVGIFEQGSGLSVDAVESSGDALLVTIVKANCNNRIGGGDSPAAPRDAVLIVSKHGGMWQIGRVANVLGAVWSGDHWIALVTAAEFGGGSSFEIWHIIQTAGEWRANTKLHFTQAASLPMPRLSADGNSLTLYSPPAACNLPEGSVESNATIETDFTWQNGQYQCVSSRVIATPTPNP